MKTDYKDMKGSMKSSMPKGERMLPVKKAKFVSFSLKDNAHSGEAKSVSPSCANMGS